MAASHPASMKLSFVSRLVLPLVGAVCLSASAHAVIIYTASGLSDSYPISATAAFDISAGQILLTLTNTTSVTHSSNQVLTGVRFSLSTGVADLSFNGATGLFAPARIVNGSGAYSDDPAAILPGTWDDVANGSFFRLQFNQTSADHGILGAPNSPGSPGDYSGSNGSIAGNPGHNPFIGETALFTITGDSITALSDVTAVRFYYNTELTVSIDGEPPTDEPPPIPEPGTLAFGLALLGACAVSRLRLAR